MKILGIDPGTATTGYGVIEVNKEFYTPLKYGLIETDKNFDAGKRLNIIYYELNKIIKLCQPDVFAIEKVFFATNAKTAIRVGQAQGVMLLSAASVNIPVFEYSPMTIKKLVAGHGRAAKEDVQKSVQKYLGKNIRSKKGEKTHFDNAADALAVALCHLFSSKENDFRPS